MKPNANLHTPAPTYLRVLIHSSGLSQREAARRIGVSERIMRQYLAPRSAKTAQYAPYSVQYALEGLVANLKIRLSFEDGTESIHKYVPSGGPIEDQAMALMEKSFPAESEAGEIWLDGKANRVYTDGGEATWYEG